MQPSHEVLYRATDGIISATGFPKRVMTTGVRVRCTSSSTARQVALNFEIGMSRILIRLSRTLQRAHDLRFLLERSSLQRFDARECREQGVLRSKLAAALEHGQQMMRLVKEK